MAERPFNKINKIKMDKVIILLADNEADIFKVSQKVSELNSNRDILLGENIIVTKDSDGNVVIKNSKGGNELSYTAGGALTGTFLGILGGPLGMLFGATFGSLVGLTGDMIKDDAQIDYLKKITDALPNDKTAFIAHIDESWEVPIDEMAKSLNVTVKRINIDEELDKSLQKSLDELDDEIEDLEDQLKNAVDEVKEKIQLKLEELKKQREEFKKQLSIKAASQKKQYENWLENLRDKVSEKIEDFKESIQEKREEFLRKRIKYQEEKLEKLKEKLD